MAGSNQALRLQGMLSDIANTVGQMGAASNWTAQNVRDYMAPDLDPSSEESLLKRQQWAMRNGYQDQANALGVSLGNLRQANQQKAAKSELAQMQTTMAQLEQERQNALANLTVPGGGPPSDAQIAEVNKNFAQAAQQLSGRIAQTAGGIDGSTGMEGAEALAGYQDNIEKERRKENISTLFANNGLTDLIPIAGELTGAQAGELIKTQGALAGRKTVGVPRKYADGSMQWLNEDGSATLMTANGQSINSVDAPEAYKVGLGKAVESGPEMDAESYQTRKNIDFASEVRTDTRESINTAIDEYGDLQYMQENTQSVLAALESGSLDTGPLEGLAARFGWGNAETGELQADAIYATLLNLNIARLTPVTEQELRLVAQLWANPGMINEQNIGALRSATRRINRGLERLDQTIESKLEDAEFYVGDEFSKRQRSKWERAKSGDITGDAPLVLRSSANDPNEQIDVLNAPLSEIMELPELQTESK